MKTPQLSTALVPVSTNGATTAALRQAVVAHLARYTGQTRTHTESDLRAFLTWCTDRGLDPLTAHRVHVELRGDLDGVHPGWRDRLAAASLRPGGCG